MPNTCHIRSKVRCRRCGGRIRPSDRLLESCLPRIPWCRRRMACTIRPRTAALSGPAWRWLHCQVRREGKCWSVGRNKSRRRRRPAGCRRRKSRPRAQRGSPSIPTLQSATAAASARVLTRMPETHACWQFAGADQTDEMCTDARLRGLVITCGARDGITMQDTGRERGT